MSRFFAISDIHILNSKDPAFRKLLNLMGQTTSGDVFFLGGDIFDFYVEDQPALTKDFSEFFEVLAKKSGEGVRFLYVEGNHDFHLGFIAKKNPKIEVNPESFKLELGGKKFYLAHGDLVDQDDKKYLMLRSVFRSGFFHMLAKALPDRVVSLIGAKSNDTFGDHTSKSPEARSLDRQKRTREKFRSFAEKKFEQGFDFVVLGHCHDLDEYRATERGRNVHYVNIGYPKKHEKYAFWESGMNSIERRPF